MNREQRNLAIFVVATLASTWILGFLIPLNGLNPYTMPGLVLFLIAGSAPSWVGVLMVLFTYDRERRRDFWRRCFSFRQIRLRWWAFIILAFPVIYAVLIAVDLALGGAMPGMVNLKAFIAQPWVLPLALVMSFFSGPFSEEFGWRGYALEPMMRRFGPMLGAAILGFIWGIWHLAWFFMPQTWHGQIGFGFNGFWNFMLYSIGLSLIMAWVFAKTKRSILSGLMLHLTSNFTGNLIYPYTDRILLMRMVVVLVLGLVLGVLMGRETTRSLAATGTAGEAAPMGS